MLIPELQNIAHNVPGNWRFAVA